MCAKRCYLLPAWGGRAADVPPSAGTGDLGPSSNALPPLRLLGRGLESLPCSVHEPWLHALPASTTRRRPVLGGPPVPHAGCPVCGGGSAGRLGLVQGELAGCCCVRPQLLSRLLPAFVAAISAGACLIGQAAAASVTVQQGVLPPPPPLLRTTTHLHLPLFYPPFDSCSTRKTRPTRRPRQPAARPARQAAVLGRGPPRQALGRCSPEDRAALQ